MDFLLELADPWGYVLVAGLALAESGGFVGLVLPGEGAMLLGGVLVYQGRAGLAAMLIAGCLGAIVGDSLGYLIGARLGPRLRRTRMGRLIGEERWERAESYLRRKGGRAVFVGRFVGVLRALLPALAGSAGIGYRRFLPFSAAGAILWAGGFILLGVAAGRSWRVVEAWAGRASLVLLALVVIAALLMAVARYVANHLDDLRARRDRFLARPRIASLVSRYSSQVDFLKRRFDPTSAYGLYLSAGVVVAIAGAWVVGALIEDVVSSEELALFDGPILRWVVRHREPVLTDIVKAATFAGTTVFVTTVLGVGALVSYLRTKRLQTASFLAATIVGAVSLDDAVKFLVGRARPTIAPLVEVSGSSFPSGHTTAIAGLCGALAYVASRGRSWKSTVWIWTVAAFVALLIGATRIYLGVHWPTDVLGGLALGAFWTSVTITGSRLFAARAAPEE